MNDEELPDNNKPSPYDLWPSEPRHFEPVRNDPAPEPPAERPLFDPYTGERIDYSQMDASPRMDQFAPVHAFTATPRIDPAPDTSYERTPFDVPLDEPFEPAFVPVEYVPESTDENVRKSGLAWSAGIAFFGSVAFTLFLGWMVDLLLGSAPWGMVVGIVLGSLIGFIQFFRISSQIYPKKTPPEQRPLLSRDEDEE
ncbi:hypothetical protein BH10ACI3_BH10ACI3_06020 [soil metagenome]